MKRKKRRKLRLSTIIISLFCAVIVLGSEFIDGNHPVAFVAGAFYWLLLYGMVALVRHRRRIWKQVLVTGVSIAVALGLAEVVLRKMRPALAYPEMRMLTSPMLHHINPASTRLDFGNVQGRQVFVRTNADGLRTDYSREDFQSYGLRIACLGDSFTFGWGVSDGEDYPAQLEALLRKARPTPDVAVLNAGVLGYSPLLEKQLFENVVVHYKPNVVLLMVDPTDIGNDLAYGLEYRPQAEPAEAFPRRREKLEPNFGALWRITKSTRQHPSVTAPWRILRRLGGPDPYLPNADGIPPHLPFKLDIDGQPENDLFFIYRYPLEKTRAYFDKSWAHVLSVQRTCQQIGARLVVLAIPRYHHWNVKECPDNWETGYSNNEPYQFEFFRYFDEKAKDSPFRVHSMLQEFKECREFPLVFNRDPHWNAAGNAFVARRLSILLANLQ